MGKHINQWEIYSQALKTMGQPAAEVRDIRLAGPEGSSEPQLTVGRVVVRIGLWGAIASLGSDLEVEAVERYYRAVADYLAATGRGQ